MKKRAAQISNRAELPPGTAARHDESSVRFQAYGLHSIQHRAIAGMTILPLFGMLARMWHIPDGLLTPTTEDYGCATIIGRLWLPKRVQRLRTGLQPCLRRQPRVVDEQPRRSPEISNNQNTERG